MSYQQEVLDVKALGDRIGYGNMMKIACVIWRDMLRKDGIPEGAHIPVGKGCIKPEDWEWIKTGLDRAEKRVISIIQNNTQL
ncbi:MAG: hypothetical protein LCH81_03615 [Bacteroidetes bacterium]|nr:hypothetical protein [Bacteroidota bacterium]